MDDWEGAKRVGWYVAILPADAWSQPKIFLSRYIDGVASGFPMLDAQSWPLLQRIFGEASLDVIISRFIASYRVRLQSTGFESTRVLAKRSRDGGEHSFASLAATLEALGS